MRTVMLPNKILFVFIFFLFCTSQVVAQPEMTFQEDLHDFGKIQEGSIATHEFRFTNTGDQPLVISNVRASCGCTTPFYTKEPVLPGKEGVITASYNSKNRPGTFHKSITISSNAKSSTLLYIKGEAVKETDPTKLYSAEELAKSPKIKLVKEKVEVGTMEVNQSVPLRIDIENKGKSPLVISSVFSDCRCVAFRPGEDMVIPAGEKKEVELLLKPPVAGIIDNDVRVFTNDLYHPETTFRLKGKVVKSLLENNMMREEGSKIDF